MSQSTIAAIATPIGSGGIGIVKISGQDALKIGNAIFRRFGAPQIFAAEKDAFTGMSSDSRGIFFGHIVDPQSDLVLDEVLLTVMRAPKSHTREDVVEINTHSGGIVIHSILELVLRQGARLAEPGEFTKRAFLNGRIDLTQAEAVIDIVNAKTSQALSWAAGQIKGSLKNIVVGVIGVLQDLLVEAEALIDFPDEIHGPFNETLAVDRLKSQVMDPLNQLVEQYVRTRFIKEGLKAVIVGKPNVGKSSLMNCLIRKERVIVSPVPGTTRDYVDEACIIRQIPMVLTDTAGLQQSDDVVENFGIQKTFENIAQADLILFVVDVSRPITSDDIRIHEEIRHKEKIIVMNKSDLEDFRKPVEIPPDWQFCARVKTSALNQEGIAALESIMSEWAHGEERDTSQRCGVSPNLRHKRAIEEGIRCVEEALECLSDALPLDLFVLDLKAAMRFLEEVVGINISPDILDEIFSRFCIGK